MIDYSGNRFRGGAKEFLVAAPIFRQLAWQMELNAATDDMRLLYWYHDRHPGWLVAG